MRRKRFGTFAGVFTPTTLTILGVIMYLRHPWVVGNAGVLGALLIVLLAVVITLTTALSISSITTNVKIGSGGAFSVISQSLGLEIGGAIGIPFYLSQALAVAMYVFGFREGLHMILPGLDNFILDVITFSIIMIIAFISTSFAFKIQYIILGIIFLSVLSIIGSLFVNELNTNIEWFGKFPGSTEDNFKGTTFWEVFAVFFPAATGVMAGANMSGELKNPRKNIPIGTLTAVVVTSIIYLLLVFVASYIATPEELVKNYNVFIEKSLFPPIVLAGLLGATLSSALASFVGAPRILLALGEKNILPKSNFISKVSKKGEPYNAMIITAIIVIIGISLRNLNTIAPLLTMFFMITYAMINIVALVEQSLGLPSYRPTLKIPIIVPLIGAFGSITIMFIMNAFVALVSLILIISFYFYLIRKNIRSVVGDSRSGLFTAIAEWATNKTTELNPDREARSWRPDLLIPFTSPKEINTSFKLIESIVSPKGSLKLLTIKNEKVKEQMNLEEFIPHILTKFKDSNIPISITSIENYEFNNALNITMQALNAAFFKPNTILMTIDTKSFQWYKYDKLIQDVENNDYGLIYYIPYNSASLSIEKNLSLWLNNIPEDWVVNYNLGNNDLSVLITYLISKNWNGKIDVNILAKRFTEIDKIFLRDMIRLPDNTEINVFKNSLLNAVKSDKNSDLNIIGIPPGFTVAEMVEIVNESEISCVFCYDSGHENALV